MNVRMKTIVAGPDFTAGPGQVINVPTEQAQALIDGGYAEAVPDVVVEEPPAGDDDGDAGTSEGDDATDDQMDEDKAATGEVETASLGPGETAVTDKPEPRKRSRRTSAKSDGG